MTSIYNELKANLPEYAPYFKSENVKKGIKKLEKKGKLLEFCQKVSADNMQNLQKIVKLAKKSLSKKDLAKLEKSEPMLFTARIKKKKNLKFLKEIAKSWKQETKDKLKSLKKSKDVQPKAKSILKDLKEESDALKDCLSDASFFKSFGERAYVALDKHNTICAMAIVDKEKKEFYVCELATAPQNVTMRKKDKPLRGSGTAVLSRISQDCLESGRKFVSLDSLSSAKDFYKKIGFKKKHEKYCDGSYVLNKAAMKKLCAQASLKVKHLAVEPELS